MNCACPYAKGVFRELPLSCSDLSGFWPSISFSIFSIFMGSHMYNNRLIYSSLQGSDPAFYSKILFAINEALQIHWCSCCNTEDRLSVNDKVLLMQDQQDMLLCHNFVQQLPKSISDKITRPSDKNGSNQGGKSRGKFKPGAQKDVFALNS
jgi:hypothetical protein